jgi:hypothetical protein
MMLECFWQRGFFAETAASGVGGLRAMNQSPLGLVVLDVMMPFIDGFEMTSAEDAFLKFARPGRRQCESPAPWRAWQATR